MLAADLFQAFGAELESLSGLFQNALEFTLAFSTTSAIDQSLDNILIIIPMCMLVLCVLLVFKSVLETFLMTSMQSSALVYTFRVPIGLLIFLLQSSVKILTQLLATLFSRYLLTLPPNGVGNSSAVTEVLPIAILSLSFFYLARNAMFGTPNVDKEKQGSGEMHSAVTPSTLQLETAIIVLFGICCLLVLWFVIRYVCGFCRPMELDDSLLPLHNDARWKLGTQVGSHLP